MKLTQVLEWEEEKVFENVEKIIGSASIKQFPNFAYWKSNHPICLMAHIDKVKESKSYTGWEWKWDEKERKHVRVDNPKPEADSLPKPVELIQVRNIVSNKNGILGADDRAGVMIMLHILNECQKHKLTPPSILLTNYEETGSQGVKEFVKLDAEIMSQVNLIVSLDRRGCNDYVFYDEQDKEVSYYIEQFGFKKAWGSYSDMSVITQAWKIPSVNLSVGYYDPHSKTEHLHLDEMYLTARRVMEVIKEPIAQRYKVEEKKKYVWENDNRYDWWNKNKDEDKDKDKVTKALVPVNQKNNVIPLNKVNCGAARDLPWWEHLKESRQITITAMDWALTDAELFQGWRIVCDDYEAYTINEWRNILYNTSSDVYQHSGYHIFKNMNIRYIDAPQLQGHFYLAVKFTKKKQYERMMDLFDQEETNIYFNMQARLTREQDVIDVKEVKVAPEDQVVSDEYCLAFYPGTCAGGCGGSAEHCCNEGVQASAIAGCM